MREPCCARIPARAGVCVAVVGGAWEGGAGWWGEAGGVRLGGLVCYGRSDFVPETQGRP